MRAEPEWGPITAALRAAPSVTLACHVNPDGDAIGSLLGAALALRKRGAEVVASWDGETELPYSYSFLPGTDLLVPPGEVAADGVFLALDCGDLDRLGSLVEPARASGTLINIDHHQDNPGFGALNAVVPEASSTAELVARLVDDLPVDMDRDIAVCLYTGVVTDTGRFQYRNASPATLRLAARLRSFGFDAPAIAQRVYESAPFGYLKLVGRVLSRAELVGDKRFVYSYVARSDLEETGVDLTETENLIDVVRSIREANVAALFKEQEDGAWRVSLRSKGGVGVADIARAHGGGGHDLAAGFTATSVEAGVKAIVEALPS